MKLKSLLLKTSDINSRYDFCCLIVMYNNCAPTYFRLFAYSRTLKDRPWLIRDLRVSSQILTICWTCSLYYLVIFIVFKGASIWSSYFLRRPQKLTKSSPLIWHLLHNVKSTVKILSIFVAFLENMNFKNVPPKTIFQHCFND